MKKAARIASSFRTCTKSEKLIAEGSDFFLLLGYLGGGQDDGAERMGL
jgi:hypothetical protein